MAYQLTHMAAAQQEQPLSEEKKLLDFSLDVICAVDADGRFTHVTAASRRVWGYGPEELLGTRYLDLVVPEDQNKTIQTAERIMQGATVTDFANKYRKKDGSVVPVLWSASWDAESRTMYCVAKDATALHLAEQRSKEYEQRLYKAYKLGGIGWWEWNALTNDYCVSDELYEIYGLSKEEYPTVTTDVYLSLVHPEDLPAVLAAISIGKTQTHHQYEHRMCKPSGEIIYVIHYIESAVDADGCLLTMSGITKDITARKTAELNRLASEQKLVTILESIGDCFFAVDKNWTVTYWNRKAEEVLQKKRKGILGKNIWKEYEPALHLRFFEAYHHAMESGTVMHFEEYFPPLNMWVEVSAYPSAEGLAVYFKDVTERKKQQEDLHASNLRYELASKATSDAIWDWDLENDVIYWGNGFETFFGYSLTELTSDISTWTQQIHPDDAERVLQGMDAFLKSTEIKWTDEYRYMKKDGRYAVVADRGYVVRDANGKPLRMVGALQDITSQKEAEEAMQLSEERFRLLFFESPKPKWMFEESSFRIVEVNKAATDLYGFTREEFLNLTIADLRLPEEVPVLYTLRETEVTHYHNIVKHRKKNGDVFLIEISTHAIDLPAGRHFIVEAEDMTQRLKWQQMVLDEKMAAQKEVAQAIIATQEKERNEIAKELHDNVNQLLTTAKLYVENIGCFPGQQSDFLKKVAALLQRSIGEIRALSKQLTTPMLNDLDFRSTLDELLHHYSSLNLFEIDLTYNVKEESLDQGLLLTVYRILQEQLNNIVKHAKASLVTIYVGEEDDQLTVVVRDNGTGFDLKNPSKGLGLNNMKNRAEVYKGTLHIRSTIGAGTEVTVSFPYLVRQNV